jgi:hypothetical protein
MSNTSSQLHEQQGSMLSLHAHGIAVREVFPPIPTAEETEYPSVSVLDRATHLTNALGAFGLRNQRLGFDTASNVGPYNRSIEARYGRHTPRVQEGAARNALKFLDDARHEFWAASGFVVMRKQAPESRNEINAAARKEWRDFNNRFSGPNDKKDRDRYISKLERSKKTAQKMAEQAIKAS